MKKVRFQYQAFTTRAPLNRPHLYLSTKLTEEEKGKEEEERKEEEGAMEGARGSVVVQVYT